MPGDVIVGDVDFGVRVLLVFFEIGETLFDHWQGVLSGHPVVVMIGNAHQAAGDGVQELRNEWHERRDSDHIDGESAVMLQEILVAAQRQTNKHAVGDARDHVHSVVPNGNVLVVVGVETPCSVEAMNNFVVNVRDDVVDPSCETFVNNSLVEDSF